MFVKSVEQNRVLNIITRVPAIFSAVCSAYIVYSIIRNKQKRSSPTQRIVLGISFADIVFSFFWFLGSWPTPRGTENYPGAFGNTQTCSIQGFFIHIGLVVTPIYNGFLALYVFLYVCRNWERQWLKCLEISGHTITVAFGLSTAIACLALNLYNTNGQMCWIWEFPEGCIQSFESIDGTTDCIRGDNAMIYQIAFAGAIVWFNIVWTFFSMTLVYLHVRKQEKKMEAYISEYSDNGSRRRSNSDSRDVAIRGVLFSGAFLLAFLPATINLALTAEEKSVFPLHVLVASLTPSQGIFNFLIYIIHPAVNRHRKEKDLKRNEQEKQLTETQVRDGQNVTEDEGHAGRAKGEEGASLVFKADTLGGGTKKETECKQTANDRGEPGVEAIERDSSSTEA